MFELIEDDSMPAMDISNGHSASLDMVDNQLEVFFDKYGTDAKKQNAMHPTNYRMNLSEILYKLGCSETIRDDANKKALVIQDQINQLNEKIQEQDEDICESGGLLDDGNIRYKNAIVSEDHALAVQLEEEREQVEKNIKWANVRKEAFNQKLESLNKSHERAHKMYLSVDHRLKQLELNDATDEFKKHLSAFVSCFDEVCRVANKMPGGINIMGRPKSYSEREKSIASLVVDELKGKGWGSRLS